MDACPAVAASCTCHLTGPHDIHECGNPDCAGQWKGTEPDFKPVRLPVAFGLGSIFFGLGSIFGDLIGE